jgi:hypothetical protein
MSKKQEASAQTKLAKYLRHVRKKCRILTLQLGANKEERIRNQGLFYATYGLVNQKNVVLRCENGVFDS